jgi:hypothetical protein
MSELTKEFQYGVLACELRDYENFGIEDTVIYGAFRLDEWLDVQQRVGDIGERKLCDVMNIISFTKTEEWPVELAKTGFCRGLATL